MNAQTYAFKLGQMACTVLLDGATVVGKAGILRRYPDATEAEYREAFAAIGLSLDTADSSFNILVAEIGDQTVLIDTGEGGKPSGGYLLESMRLVGIAPEAITLVVITHAHGDHVMGLVADNGAPVFPQAKYVISKPEMHFWQGRIANGVVDHGAIVRMMETQGLRLIDMNEHIMPGLSAVGLPGHTPGQIGVLLESEGAQLLHMADLVHSPMQFAHPEWSPSFDVDPSISVPTRRAVLGRAADQDLLTLLYHLTFPGLGWVRRADRGFRWEPHTQRES